MSSLQQISGISDQNQKKEKYNSFLTNALNNNSTKDLKDLVTHLMNEDVIISRALLQTFATNLTKLKDETHKEVAEHSLEVMQPKLSAFEEQLTIIRTNLSAVYEDEEDWKTAARVLSGISLVGRTLDPDYKVGTYVKIAQLYLEDDDSVSAESYINRAAELFPQVQDTGLKLRYKASLAKCMDFKKQFLKAALRYYELSQIVPESDREYALKNAMICTILIPSGPQRSRMLATLYKDERTSKIDIFPFLEKMYSQRILRKIEVDNFRTQLKPHHLTKLSDDTTYFDRAVVEHNVLSASKIYNNISFSELGNILGVAPEKAESTASKMIIEERLDGTIDQLLGLLIFQHSSSTSNQWDSRVATICNEVNDVIDIVTKKNPNYKIINKK